MKTSPLFNLTFAATLLAAVLSGCTSGPFARKVGPDPDKPVGGQSLKLLDFRDQVRATRFSLNSAYDALNRIPDSAAPKQAYEAFRTAMTDFVRNADATLKEADQVRARGNMLFAEWSAETESIQNADIRQAAEQRRLALRDSYNSMLDPLNTARNDLSRARADLLDIQKAIALDLTRDGLNSAKGTFNSVKNSTDTAVRSLDELGNRLDRIAETLPRAAATTRK